MVQFLLRENVLTDNILEVPSKDYIFKGGYVARVKEYTFETAWSDKQTVKKFRSKDRLFDYLEKQYGKDVVYDLDFTDTCLC